MLHNKLVVAPIDKASGNVAFVCQMHYAQVLINELGLNNFNNITSTYTKANKLVVLENIYNIYIKFNI